MFCQKSATGQPMSVQSENGATPDDLLPGRGRRGYAGRRKLGGVVPDGVLVGALKPHAIELAVGGHELVPGVTVVGRKAADDAGQILDGALLGEGLYGAGVGYQRDVRRSTTLDRRAQRGADGAALGRVADSHPGLGRERHQRRLESLFLPARPFGPQVDRPADVLPGGWGA